MMRRAILLVAALALFAAPASAASGPQEELQRLLKPWRSAVCRITGKGCNAAPQHKRRMHPEESESELAEELEEELEEAVSARSTSLSIA